MIHLQQMIFPTNTSFSQIGILKNPTSIGSTSLFTDPTFSSVGALKLSTANGTPTIGETISHRFLLEQLRDLLQHMMLIQK